MNRRTRKLSVQERVGIALLYRKGLFTQKELAGIFSVSAPRISQIVNDPAYAGDEEE